MAVIKALHVSKRLTQLQHKQLRSRLTDSEQRELFRLRKGFEGEQLFQQLVDQHLDHGIVSFDHRLEVDDKEFQMDALIIMQDELFIFEVKWLSIHIRTDSGNFYFNDSGERIVEYSQQRERTQHLMNKWLRKHGLRYHFHYYHVFINAEQRIYNRAIDDRCLHYFDIPQFLKEHSVVPLFHDHHDLLERLMTSHLSTSRYDKQLILDCDAVKNGVLCPECMSYFLTKKSQKQFICGCGCHYSTEAVLAFAIQERMLLFPELPLTVEALYRWCDEKIAVATIRRYMTRHFRKVGRTKGSYYIEE